MSMIGLGSYAYFWRHRAGMSLEDALRDTAALGVPLFQICDYPPIETADLGAVRAVADELGLVLELGTRGLETTHLRRYLEIAQTLGAGLVRSMVNTPAEQAQQLLEAIEPELAASGVTLALENYEQIPTAELVRLISGREHVGICLDPANNVAVLEHPDAVIDLAAEHAVNLHIKDFAFTRTEGWVGFSLAGAPLGDGLLPLQHLLQAAPHPNRVVEHWLPWQGDSETSCERERAWTDHSIRVLKENA
ncbi:sugar phosphate isomerase/epimerase family protein [Pseudactinotalea terrae]|uniref:sugar phosphate isomerase/epimerase family protein n=1 Tax=Pseudactinotalea terrae TaxID=1743262 RepID=UPI0030C7E05C